MTPAEVAAIRALAEELRGASTTMHHTFRAARNGDYGNRHGRRRRGSNHRHRGGGRTRPAHAGSNVMNDPTSALDAIIAVDTAIAANEHIDEATVDHLRSLLSEAMDEVDDALYAWKTGDPWPDPQRAAHPIRSRLADAWADAPSAATIAAVTCGIGWYVVGVHGWHLGSGQLAAVTAGAALATIAHPAITWTCRRIASAMRNRRRHLTSH
jgi:hypothetical protein